MLRGAERAAIKKRIIEVLKEFDGTPTMKELSEELKLGYARVRSIMLLDNELAELALLKGMRLKGARLGRERLYKEPMKEQKRIDSGSALCTVRILKGEVGNGLVLDISNPPANGFQSAWNYFGWESENIYTLHPDVRVLTKFGRKIKTTRLIAGNYDAVPVESESFDYAILTHVIHEMDNPVEIGKMMREMNRLLKNEGTLVITAPEAYEPESRFFNQVKEIGFGTSFAGSSVITYNGGVHETDHIDTFIQLKKMRETTRDAAVSPFFHSLLEPETSPSVEASKAKDAKVRKVARRFFWDPEAVSFDMSSEEIEAKMRENRYAFVNSLRKLPINRKQEEALIRMLINRLIPRREDGSPANGPGKTKNKRLKRRA